jgi:predicted ATPase/DNA-binding CsgD family transcriptional regulator
LTVNALRRLGELPVEVTGFVGRQRELAELTGLLGSARLVTVSGPGGVGKTRVALRAAAQLSGQFSGGIQLVELSGLRDAELLPNTVATQLGLPEQDARSQLDAIIEYLRNRHLLLILDTCEHMVDACAMLADILLRETAGVTVLATSRQPLDVPGEYTCSIVPLPGADAIELFAQRAASVVPGFAVTDVNRGDVTTLCQRLDGVPLAIELAAVRLRAMSLDQLVTRLEDRFRLLTGGRRATLPHHQTLRTAIGWSYELCSPAEQLLWARLSVFAGAFDVTAAEEVCTGWPLDMADILETLVALVDKSVVLRVEDDGTQYRLLDTIREFGAEKLARAGEEPVIRRQFTERYQALAAAFGSRLVSEDQLARYRELRREHANIRAALDYALAAGYPEAAKTAAALASSLDAYWQISSRLAEGRYWLTKVLGRFPDPSPSSPERALALIVRAHLATYQGDAAEAHADLTEGIALATSLGVGYSGADYPRAGYPEAEMICARGYLYLNLVLALMNRGAEAAEAGATAQERATALGDVEGLVTLDAQMGYVYMLGGDAGQAIARCAQGLDRLGRHRQERWLRSWLHFVTGLALFMQGSHEASAAELVTCLVLKHELGDSMGIAYALEGIAWTAAIQQRHSRAAALLGAAEPLWQLVSSRLGRIAILEEQHALAEAAARSALGEEAWTSLYRRGAGCPLDQVIALAVSDRDDLNEVSGAVAAGPAATGQLTRREREIAALVAEGLSNREVSERLVISKRTVDAHVEHVLAKLGASSRVQIATWLRSESAQ